MIAFGSDYLSTPNRNLFKSAGLFFKLLFYIDFVVHRRMAPRECIIPAAGVDATQRIFCLTRIDTAPSCDGFELHPVFVVDGQASPPGCRQLFLNSYVSLRLN